MTGIVVEAVSALSYDRLATLMTRAFAGYVAPVSVSAATLRGMVERDDILLDASLVARVDGDVAGLALVAVRPFRAATRTRLAAMGVVPGRRRTGVGSALLRRVVDDARGRGSRRLALEAFASNRAALRLYEAHGFVVERRLLGFTLPGAGPRAHGARAVSLRGISAPAALPLFALASGTEPRAAAPPWQLEGPSLARLAEGAEIYAVLAPNAPGPVGYLALGGVVPASDGTPYLRLLHLGILPPWRRRGLATAALVAALDMYERDGVAGFTVGPLVPEGSTLVPFLLARGAARAPEEQVEMALHGLGAG